MKELSPGSLQVGKSCVKVAKGNLRSARTTLTGQAKGSASPRLHCQQQQGVNTGGKGRGPEDLGSMQCGPAQICPTCCQKTNSPWTGVPGACSSALKGAHGSEPQLGTANQHLHRQPAPKTPALTSTWTAPCSAHISFNPPQPSRERICSPYHSKSVGQTSPKTI